MTTVEQYFPRGGYSTNEKDQKGKSNTKEQLKKHANSEKLFGKDLKKLKKQKDDDFDLEPFSMSHDVVPDHVDTLSYQKIKDGMLVLGCVNFVTSMNGIQVQLPGRCYGQINIQDISDEYTKYLTAALEENKDPLPEKNQFQPGDFLPVKVLAKISEENGFRIPLSTKPEDVNSNIKFNHFSTGMMLWASVIERSDHCYNLNAGIPNCRVVLPFKNSKIEYSDGTSVWCVVQNANIQEHASILTVSTLDEDLQKVAPLKKDTSLDDLTPGMTVTFDVKKVLKDGLRGTICQNCTAFIETANLTKIKDNPQNYKIGQKLSAILLFVQPTTKFSYLTLQRTSNVPSPRISMGAKLSGRVLSRKDRGIYVLLKSDARGFVPYNRLLIRENLKKKSDEPEKTSHRLIADAYPKNSSFHLRVMDYNYMDRTYICTNQPNIMAEKYFTLSDFKIGDTVKGSIKEIKSNGVVFSVGKVQGFIPNIHLCDVQYTETMKSKLKVGQKLNAKVLNLKPNNIYFTLKRSLMSNDLNLSSADQIDSSKHYPGVVVRRGFQIFHVQFYGGFGGQLKISHFKNEGDIANMFYIGQVITTSITRIEDDVPILSMLSDGDENDDAEDKNGNKKKSKKRTISESSTKIENVKKKTKVHVEAATESLKMNKINGSNKDIKSKSKNKDHSDTKTQNEPKNKKRKVAKTQNEPKNKDHSAAKTQNVSKNKEDSAAITQNDDEDEDKQVVDVKEEPQATSKKCKLEKNKNLLKDESENTELIVAKPSKPSAIRGVSDFFGGSSTRRLDSESEVEEEEEVVEQKKKPKKSAKQSAEERKEKAREEEARLRAIETQLADNTIIPQSAEHFDRLLLGEPNSSKLWAQYIAFHMQSIEIEKARAVAKRALQSINLSESQERLNIWTIFMNLEHEFGTKDSYDEIFKEAATCNNSLPIYLLAIENHVGKGELSEANIKWRKLKREHKNNIQMWIKVGKIYYENQKFEEARKLKDEGLKTITDKSMQIDLIVKFAIFEFTYGFVNQGQSLFETIVQSDPKRVSVWSTYIDQLVKKNEIDLARRVLDRAVGNKIPFKKMKTLFKKYYQFEKEHGDAERQAYVEKLAREYAVTVSAN